MNEMAPTRTIRRAPKLSFRRSRPAAISRRIPCRLESTISAAATASPPSETSWHDPITPASIFHVASISKQFAAFTVALLAQEGRLSLDDESLAADVASLRAAGAGADELAASKQVQELLGRAVDALPPDLRHAVQLSTLEELNSAEISALLGIPEGTVRTRLMRARALLREALAPALGARHD